MSLKSKKNKKYLFVCTGNTCRSPIGEYVAKEIAAEKGLEIEVGSRGTNAFGSGIFKLGCSKETCQLVMEKYPNSKIFTHIPSILTFKDLDYYNLILTMEENHRDDILREGKRYFPGLEKRVFSLKELGGEWGEDSIKEYLDVQDPIGAGNYYGGGGQCGFVHDDPPSVVAYENEELPFDEENLEVLKDIGEPGIDYDPDEDLEDFGELGIGGVDMPPYSEELKRIGKVMKKKHPSSGKAPVKTPKTLYVNHEKRMETYRNCMEEIEYCVNNVLSGNIHSWGEILERRELREEYLKKIREEYLKKPKVTKGVVKKIPLKTTKTTKPAGQVPGTKVKRTGI